MAYCPIGEGDLAGDGRLRVVAERHNATPAQVALAWTIRGTSVIAIPKAAQEGHVRDNRAAADIRLTAQDIAELDAAFPPPRRKQPLAMV